MKAPQKKQAAKKAAKKAVAKKTGRPSSYTKAKGDAVCKRLAEGESLRSICLDKTMPSTTAVFRWVEDNEAFRSQYARARESQAWILFEETLELADSALGNAKGEPGTGEAGARVQAIRLQIDQRKWFLSKVLPKVFGERLNLEHTGKDGGAIKSEQSLAISDADEAMILRIRERREAVKEEQK